LLKYFIFVAGLWLNETIWCRWAFIDFWNALHCITHVRRVLMFWICGGPVIWQPSRTDMVGQVGSCSGATLMHLLNLCGRDSSPILGKAGNIEYVQANAEALPFLNNYLRLHNQIGLFGLRKSQKEKALGFSSAVLNQVEQIISTGILSTSQLVKKHHLQTILRFQKSYRPLGKCVYQWSCLWKYSHIWPNQFVCIQDQSSLKMMEEAGFERVTFSICQLALVALHSGL